MFQSKLLLKSFHLLNVFGSEFFHFGFVLLVFLFNSKIIIFVVLFGILLESLQGFLELLLFFFLFGLNSSLVLSKVLFQFLELKFSITELDLQSLDFRDVFRRAVSRMQLETEVFWVLGGIEMRGELDSVFLEVGEDLSELALVKLGRRSP